jgi:hypothetical protein
LLTTRKISIFGPRRDGRRGEDQKEKRREKRIKGRKRGEGRVKERQRRVEGRFKGEERR